MRQAQLVPLLVALGITAPLDRGAAGAAPKLRALPTAVPTPSARWQGLRPLNPRESRESNLRRTLPDPPRLVPEPPPPPGLAPALDPPPAPAPADAAPFSSWPPGPPMTAPAYPALGFVATTPRRLPFASPLPAATLDDVIDQDAAPAAKGGGIFVRATAGPNLFRIGATANREASSSVHGWGFGLALLVGGWVAPAVVVGGGIALATALNPDITGDAIVPTIGPSTLSTFSAGANLTYVIEPLAASVSASLLLSQVRLVDQLTSYVHSGSRLGPALAVGASKEWAISEDWGLGASFRAQVAWPQDVRRSMNLTALAACFAVSASYD